MKSEKNYREEILYTHLNDHLDSVVALIPGHVYWKDINGNYLGCNNVQAKSLGLKSRYDIVSRRPYEKLGDKEIERLKRIDEEIIKQKKTITEEEPGIRENGEIGIFLTRKSPLLNKKNEVIGILGVSIDITDKKRAEKLEKKIIVQKRKKAEQLADTMRLVASSIAHELRTPLCAISCGITGIEKFFPKLLEGYSKAKENNLLDSKPIRENQFFHISNITKSLLKELNSANFIINMLLKNITPELGEIEKSVISIYAVLEETLSTYPFDSNEAQLIHWDRSVNFSFLGNQELLKHVFYNLIKNALYFIKDHRKGEIFIWCERKDSENIIYFKDTCKGLSQEETKHLFDAFYSKRQGGSGVGLAFCKMVIKSFNGKISCRSIKGEFLEFIIKLPRVFI